jgi:hypothetical protein
MTPGGRSSGVALATLFIALAWPASALPPTRDEIAQWCNDADDTTQCGRLIEAQQLKRLPGLARRDGVNLEVALFPSGTATFTDVDDTKGSVTYSLWDTLDPINGVVMYVTRDDKASYIVLQRNTGHKTEMEADPVLSPDRAHLVTADFCANDCTNEVVLWRVSRDSIVREATWRPQPGWSDAAVHWKDDDTVVAEYTPVGASDSRTVERKLGDPVWRKAAVH